LQGGLFFLQVFIFFFLKILLNVLFFRNDLKL
jgi:hypothetical protein